MLNYERTFKIKVRSPWTALKILITSAVICMETRLSNIFKNTNLTKLTKAILESSYRVLKLTSKWETLKDLVYF